MAGKKEFIQQQSLLDPIRTLGEEYQSEGLHVYETEKIPYELPFYTPISADHFTIFIVRSGNIRLKLNLMEYRVKRNGIVIITPETVGQLVEVSPGWRGMGMGFTADFMFRTGIHRNHIESFDFFASPGTRSCNWNSRTRISSRGCSICSCRKNLINEAHSFRNEVVLHSFSLFMYELAAIYSKYHAALKIILSRKEDLLMRFLKLLSTHFKAERSVQFYAGLLFVTPKHLTETVKELTGKTAGEFIDEIVVTEAKLLLLDPSLSVAGVAESLDFSDPKVIIPAIGIPLFLGSCGTRGAAPVRTGSPVKVSVREVRPNGQQAYSNMIDAKMEYIIKEAALRKALGREK